MDEIERIRELAEKATPAPWQQSRFVDNPRYRAVPEGRKEEWRGYEREVIRSPGVVGESSCNPVMRCEGATDEDRALVIALRNAWPTLLARIEAADRMRAALRATTTHPCKASETELAEALRDYDATMRGSGNDPRPT